MYLSKFYLIRHFLFQMVIALKEDFLTLMDNISNLFYILQIVPIANNK